ncbi:DUF3566 domain-containing protein [Microbacterium sp. NPDC058389]|uniref:DUF3566 domain-containing protein n=1 Tax=Microbacterium sp. NPDC058389 TaxID=3346475 RepID=UPI003650F9E4
MSSIAGQFAEKSSSKKTAKQVRLRLVYVDFWSAMKLSFLAAIAVAVITVVGVVLLYLVVQSTEAFTDVEAVLVGLSDGSLLLSEVLGLAQVVSFATVAALLNLVVVTVLGAVLAGIYNLAVKVTDGLPVGLTSSTKSGER